MFGGVISGLICAWILVQFGIDKICMNVLQLFLPNIMLTTDHFYFVFGAAGFVVGAIHDMLH